MSLAAMSESPSMRFVLVKYGPVESPSTSSSTMGPSVMVAQYWMMLATQPRP